MKTYVLTYDGLIDETIELYEFLQELYWPNSDITVLGYKSPTYKSDTIKFDSLGIDNGTNGVPSQLYDYFSKIEDRHFIFGVDDIPFISKVKFELLDEVEQFMCENESIGRFGLTADELTRPTKVLWRTSSTGPFTLSFNLQACSFDFKDANGNPVINWHQTTGGNYKLAGCWSIWDREYFLLYINNYDNLWQWELDGSVAANKDDKKVFTTCPPIMTHAHMIKRGQFRDNWQQEAVQNSHTMSLLVENKIKQIFKLDE